eukprot:421211-Prorocentrum_minimum.AAC.2
MFGHVCVAVGPLRLPHRLALVLQLRPADVLIRQRALCASNNPPPQKGQRENIPTAGTNRGRGERIYHSGHQSQKGSNINQPKRSTPASVLRVVANNIYTDCRLQNELPHQPAQKPCGLRLVTVGVAGQR